MAQIEEEESVKVFRYDQFKMFIIDLDEDMSNIIDRIQQSAKIKINCRSSSASPSMADEPSPFKTPKLLDEIQQMFF